MQHKPTYGNYRGYYQSKRPTTALATSSLDPRLALLPDPTALFEARRVLDVGCNEGWVTCEIAQYFNPQHITGVDIDHELIRLAWKRRRTVWSLQQPWPPLHCEPELDKPPQDTEGKKPKKQSKKRKRSDVELELEPHDSQLESPLHPIYDYFPLAMEHMFGPIDIPNVVLDNESPRFPHNLTFRAADWVDQAIPEDKDAYDTVIAFSISKWIHLNKGDDGMKRFFRKVYDVLNPGGSFILEPQPWDSYAKARRMDEKLKQMYQTLQLRPNDFPNILLSEIGFTSRKELGRAGEGGFDRPVDIYVKPLT